MTDPTQGSGRASAEDVKNQSEFYELLVKSNAEAAKLNELLVERADALSLTAEKLRSQTELQNKIATNFLNEITNLDQIIEKRKSLENFMKNTNMGLEEMLEMEVKLLSLKDDEAKTLKEIEERTKSITDLEKLADEQGKEGVRKLKEEEKQFLNLLKIKVDGKNTLSKILTKEGVSEKERRDALEAAKGINKDFLDLQTKVRGVSEKVATSVGLSAKFSDTFLGKAVDLKTRFGQMSEAIGEGGIKSAMFDIVGESFNLNNIFSAIFEESFKIAVQIEKISKELGKATGFGNVFAGQIRDVGNNLTLLGGSEESAGKIISSMTEGLSSFNPTADKTNTTIATTIGKMELLGVAAASSVKAVDILQRTMGMSAEQAADATAQISRMGKTIGVSGTKMINDFNSASGRLAIYGKNNIEVFKGLAAAAKATGIEMQSLINVSKQFDTFDSAADSAAKLNAVLGTQLSTLELMSASDEERILMIKQQVQASVGNFDSLDKFTKMYIQQAMGVSDVAEAQRLLNMSTAEYQKYQQGQKEQVDIQKELSEATAELVPTMQKLGILAAKFFKLFTPFINGFLMIGEGIDFLYSKFAGLFSGMSGMADNIVTVLKYVAIALGIVTAPISGTAAAIMGIVVALGALYDILHLPGSLSMAEGMFDKTIGPSVKKMGKDSLEAKSDLSQLNSEMQNAYDVAHPDGNILDIQAAANIDTNAIASGITKVKSALMELSTLKIDGFLAMSTDGAASSFIMGSESVIKNLSEGKLTVDVKIPEMKMPDVHVKVYIGDRELRDIIRSEIDSKFVVV